MKSIQELAWTVAEVYVFDSRVGAVANLMQIWKLSVEDVRLVFGRPPDVETPQRVSWGNVSRAELEALARHSSGDDELVFEEYVEMIEELPFSDGPCSVTLPGNP